MIDENTLRLILEDIIEDIEPSAMDDSGLHIPRYEIDKAVDRIMKKLEELGFWS